MNLALCGWCTDSGLGYEFRDALKHLPVSSAFVLKNNVKPTIVDDLRGTPCMQASRGGVPDLQEMRRFLDRHRPDTILTWEIPGNWQFPQLWRSRGIRWIHVVHWDWFYPQYAKVYALAHRLIAPNELCQRELIKHRLKTTMIPVPVDVDRFPFVQRTKADRFLSVTGFGGANGRRGLDEIVKAWEKMPKAPKLVMPAQRQPRGRFRPNQAYDLVVKPVRDPNELYQMGDVAVQLSRFEGVGLTFMEAQACGLVTIAVDAEPMNWLAPFKTVKVARTAGVKIAGKTVQANIADPDHLVEIIRSLRGKDISELSLRGRKYIEENFSWQALQKSWIEALA